MHMKKENKSNKSIKSPPYFILTYDIILQLLYKYMTYMSIGNQYRYMTGSHILTRVMFYPAQYTQHVWSLLRITGNACTL